MNSSFILGYGTLYNVKSLGFTLSENKNKNLVLFIGYSDCEVPEGYKFEFKIENEIKYLELKQVNLYFGNPIKHIPKGFKSIVLVESDEETITKIKEILPKVTKKNHRKICGV